MDILISIIAAGFLMLIVWAVVALIHLLEDIGIPALAVIAVLGVWALLSVGFYVNRTGDHKCFERVEVPCQAEEVN